MKLKAIILAAVITITPWSANAAQISDGAKCVKVGQTTSVSGASLKCTKNGSKQIWKTIVSSAPMQKSAEITFDNLFLNRKFISYTAWKKTSDLVAASSSKLGQIDLNTGPNTKPWFDQIQIPLSLVSRAFPNQSEAKNILVIQYNYGDQDWATKLLKTKISQQIFDQLDRQEGGRLLSSNCEPSGTCRGSKQVTTNDGLAILLIGVPNTVSQDPTRYTSGQLLAHEYFHSLQRIPMLNKNLQNNYWPPRWFLEGSAEWVQNSAVNFNKFDKYSEFIRNDCYFDSTCYSIPEASIKDYLSQSNKGNGMSDYDQKYAYNIGSRFSEVLAAIKGPESLIQIWIESSKGEDWNTAFKAVYGADWDSVYPNIVKAVYANIQERV